MKRLGGVAIQNVEGKVSIGSCLGELTSIHNVEAGQG